MIISTHQILIQHIPIVITRRESHAFHEAPIFRGNRVRGVNITVTQIPNDDSEKFDSLLFAQND